MKYETAGSASPPVMEIQGGNDKKVRVGSEHP